MGALSSTMEELTVVLRADDRRLRRQLQTTTRNVTRQLGRTATTATRAGQQTGQGFTRGITQSTTRGMATVPRQVQRSLATTQATATRTGTQVGQSFARGMTTAVSRGTQATTRAATRPLQATVAPAAQAGQRAGRGFTAGLTSGMAGSRAAVSGAMGSMRSEASGVSGAVSRIGGSFKSMAGVAAGALGAIGITKFAEGVFQVGAQINEARASLTGMYGDADQARDMVSQINSEFRRSTVGVGVLNDLATNLAYLGFEGEGALDIIRNIDTAASALPGDAAGAVQSVSNALLTAQVQGNAFVGELNQISRIGFPIFDALAQHLDKTSGEIKDMASQGEISFEDLMAVMTDPSLSEFWTMTEEAAQNTSRTFRQSFSGMVNSVQVSFAEMLDAGLNRLAPGMNSVADAVDSAMDALPRAMSRAAEAADRWGVTDALRAAGRAARSLASGALPVISGFATGVGTAFGGILVALRPVFRMFQAIGDWMSDNADIVRTFTAVVTALGTAWAVLRYIPSLLGAIRVGIGGLFTAMGPIGWAIMAVGALAVGLKYLWDNSETMRRIVGAAFDRVRTAASRVADFFSDRVWPVLVDGWTELRDAASPIVTRVLGWFRQLRSGAGDFADRWGFIWEFATTTLSDFWDLASRILRNIGRQFRGWIDIIAGIFTGDWARVWEGAQEVASAGWDNIVAIFTTAARLIWRGVRLWFWDLPRNVAGWLVANVPAIWNGLRTWWTDSFLPWFEETAPKIQRELRTWWTDTFVPWLAGRPAAFKSWFNEWWEDSFKPWFDETSDNIKSALNEWWDDTFLPWLKSRPSAIASQLKEWTKEFTTWASGLWDSIDLSSFASGIWDWGTDIQSDINTKVAEWTQEFKTWASGLWDDVKEEFNFWGENFTGWMEDFAEDLPENLEDWTDEFVDWIDEFAEELPGHLDEWTSEFVEWIEEFAEDLPGHLEEWTERFVDWATGAPDDTAEAFKEADGAGQIEEQIENDWGPRLLMAFGRAILNLTAAIPGMVWNLGWALQRALWSTLGSLQTIVWDRMSDLADIAAAQWQRFKDDSLKLWESIKAEVGRKVDEFVDDTVGRFTGLYDELVGNSIVPDMVNDIISETGRLPEGVGDNIDGMSADSIKKAQSMQLLMVAQMQEMNTQVQTTVKLMQVAAVGVIGALSGSVIRELQRMVLTTLATLTTLSKVFTSVFTAISVGTMTSFSGLIKGLTSSAAALSGSLQGTFTTMGRNIVRGFNNTVKGVSAAMDGMKSAVGSPVRYVISPIYNSGLRVVWNRVADKVPGLSPMAAMSAPRFREGGLVDLTDGGSLPGFSVQDNRLAMVRDGESVLTPAATRGLGGKSFVDAANQLGTGAAKLMLKGVDGFSRGGVVSLTNGFRRADENYFKDGAPKAARAALNPMAGMVGDRYGRGNTFPGQGYHSVRAWNAAAINQVIKHKDMLEGGDGQAVVNEARKHIGKSGRPNEFMRPYMGGSWPWCGAFVGTTFKRAGAYDAINAVDWKPLVRSYTSLPKVPASAARPGDLPLYRGDSGHINIVEDPKRRTTIGGNESNAVRRQTGYMNSASSIRRPNFARGGMIDFGQHFWGQNRRETTDVLAPHDARMRDIFNGVQTYDQGGWLAPGYTLAYNDTGGPEPIGAEPIEVIIDLKGDDKDMMRKIRKRVSIEGGGNVQVALGSGRRG